MKTIKIPEPITLIQPDGSIALDDNKQPIVVTFKNFVLNTLLVDPKFGKTMADILSAVEIKQKLSLETEKLELDNVDWEKLKTVAEEPSSGYATHIVVQLVSFLLAIKNAT